MECSSSNCPYVKVREKGKLAFCNNLHLKDNPYKGIDKVFELIWEIGWKSEERWYNKMY